MNSPGLSPPRSGLRRGVSRIFVIAGFVLLATALVASLVMMARKSAEAETEAEAIRLLRMSPQALMEVDVALLDMIARREPSETSRYARAVNKLGRYGPANFPATVRRAGRDVPAEGVISGLRQTWSRIVASVEQGSPDAARAHYVDYQVSEATAALIDAAMAEIDRREARQLDLQRDVKIAMGAMLASILLIGLLAFWTTWQRAVSGRRELERAIRAADGAREAASAASEAAHSSREQVLRLFQMTEMLQSAADHQDANAVLRATAYDLIPGFGGALYVFSNSRDRLALSTSWSLGSGSDLPDTIGLAQCWSLKRGKPHVNVPNSHKLACEHYTGGDCVLEIPMIARGEILGLLQIHAIGEDGETRLSQIESLGSALADGMSLALANIALREQLRGQALRDPLTGLYNRRYMEDALLRLAGLAEREKTDLSVIMIDLDHFKRLNDNYGHAKGDAVLRDAASIVMHQLRETDIACRYGGEELIVVLPSCGLERAVAKAEQLRIAIEAMSEPNGVQVSASMGVATIPTTSVAPRDMLATADAALYQAKQAGRNRVVAATKIESVETDPPRGRRIELVAGE